MLPVSDLADKIASGQGTRPRQRPRGGRRPAYPVPPPLPLAGPDLLLLAALGVALTALLLRVAVFPATGVAFAADDQPPGVALRDFYDVERNDAGPYRWSRPDASLIIPVAAPADYRITLALQGGAAVGPPRPATLSVNGAVAGTFALDDTAREYTVQHRVDPRAWTSGRERAVQLGLRTAPLTAPGDPRALGAILTRVAVEPLRPVGFAWAALPGQLALLSVAYIALRLAG